MSEYLKQISIGLDILFGNEKINVKRHKTADTKKELKIAKTIRKTSVMQRSTNRIYKTAKEALG